MDAETPFALAAQPGDTATVVAELRDGAHALLKNPYTVDLVSDGSRWLIRRMHTENTWLAGDPLAIFGA